jgi:hypothetical protein
MEFWSWRLEFYNKLEFLHQLHNNFLVLYLQLHLQLSGAAAVVIVSNLYTRYCTCTLDSVH